MDIKLLKVKKHNLIMRARMFSAIREHFENHDFLEVETDIRINAPAPEEYIEAISAENKFLRCSPELEMKIMLSAGYERIFQIGRCFRADEYGRKHREEFTMLEYYASGMGYMELAKFTCSMINRVSEKILSSGKLSYQNNLINLSCPPEVLTVAEAFRRYTSMSMQEAHEKDTFDELMAFKIEPNLGLERMTILAEYPAERASLAQLKKGDNSVAERWDLYISGIELANAYGELTDATEQRKRFAEATKFRQEQKMNKYPEAKEFFDALEYMPAASGAALGLDRLAMLFCDATDIAEVRAE